MATFTKPPFSVKVVWKKFQFTKKTFSEPGLTYKTVQ